MYAVSNQFRNALSASHRAVTSVTLIDRHGTHYPLSVDTGDITADRTAQTWRTLKMQISDPDFYPSGKYGGVLEPYGTVVLPRRGVRYEDGSTETVPLGIFRISNVEMTESAKDGSVSVSVSADDMSRLIRRNKFVDPFIIAAGTRTSTAVRAILQDRFPRNVFSVMPEIDFVNRVPDHMDVPLGVSAIFGQLTGSTGNADPWENCQKLAMSVGAWIFVNVQGQWVFEPIPTGKGVRASWTWRDGTGGLMVGADRTLDDQETYNGIVLTCHHRKIKPFRVQLWDTDPNSSTYYLGPFGKVPKMVLTKLCTTHAQAMTMARALYRANCGFTDTTVVTGPPMPAIEIGDVDVIARERWELSGNHVLDGFTIPLNVDEDGTVSARPQAVFLH